MSSLSRTEYRREEQRRVNQSPFRETKWDQHLDTLLTDLNDSVGPGGGSQPQTRSLVPAMPGQGQVTERHGVPGSGDFHERREFVSPDQKTRVVQERYEHTNRGDDGTVPGRIIMSNRYQTTNTATNRWPGSTAPAPDYRKPSYDYGNRAYNYNSSRRAHDLRSPDALRFEPDHSRNYDSRNYDNRNYDNRNYDNRNYDSRSLYDFVRRGADSEPPEPDLRSEPDFGRGYDPEPFSRARAGSLRSESGYSRSRTEPEPLGRRHGSARYVSGSGAGAGSLGRRSPPYAEVYRTGAELAGYGYTRPYEPPGTEARPFARALSPIHPARTEASRGPTSTNYSRYTMANQAVTKQVYQSSYKSSDHPGTQNQPAAPPAQDNRFKQNILELDSLLDDLDHARKKPNSNGVDPGTTSRDGPSVTSTPYRHINVQKTINTSKYTTSSGPEPSQPQPTPGDHLTAVGLTGPRHSPSPNPLDGLDRNLVPELSEPPQPGTTRVTKYEYRSSNRRDVSPQPAAPAPLQQSNTLPPPETRTYVDSRREYTSNTSRTNTLERQPPPAQPTDKTVVYNVYNKSESTLPGVPPPGAPPAGVPTPVVPPTQPGSNTTINYHIYNYGTLGPDGLPVGGPGSAPPSEVGGPRTGTLPRPDINQTTTTTNTYEHYRDASPPPHQHRSPMPGPDTTISNSYVYEKNSRGPTPQRQQPPPQGTQPPGGPNTSYSTHTITKHYKVGPDGQQIPVRDGSPDYPKFPVDDGTQPPGGQHTRTTTTTIERTHTHGSPFPARSPSPGPHRPVRDDGPRRPFPGTPRHHVDDIDTPRRVDELMAQIPDTPQDGTYPHGPRRRDLTNGQHSTHTTHFTVHETEPLIEGPKKVTLDARSGAVVPHTPTKPVAGMPIYYPPGSTEFKHKPDNAMTFQSYESSGGGGKYASKSKSGWKASGKSSSKSGSSERHAEGGAVVPICLPLCCGAACSVM